MNYEELIVNGVPKDVLIAKKLANTIGDYSKLKCLYDKYSLDEIKFCDKFAINYCARNNRLYNKIGKMIKCYDSLFFVTLTFTDDCLKSTNVITRRTYVRKFLKSISDNYIANIDFGVLDDYLDDDGVLRKGSHREHYHCLVITNYVNFKLWSSHGYCMTEKVNKDDISQKKLAKYIAKFTNHASKVSTKYKFRLIYSRER